MHKREIAKLKKTHSKESIKKRLDQGYKHSYLSDGVLGGIDGCITTFAVVAGTVGGGLEAIVAIILGISNLIADGFSMAVSNYQATKSDREIVEAARKMEERHIRLIPEGEKEEIRQIFARKAIEGKTLEEVVKAITSDKKLWIDTMIAEEFGLQLEGADPKYSAIVTFLSFLFVGSLPLIPFLFNPDNMHFAFKISCLIAALSFFAIGIARSLSIGHEKHLKLGLETLFTGGIAAILAYSIGHFVRMIIVG